MTYKYFTILLVLFLLTGTGMIPGFTPSTMAASKGDATAPDFTKGEPIPEGYTHDWNLGPTGLRGWIHCERLTTTDARQIRITKVDPGSPADGIIHVDDIILGIDGKPFDGDARERFARAITQAEENGTLSLLRWSGGTTDRVTLQLQKMGSYSPTAPFNCAKSAKIMKQGWDALAKKMADESGRSDSIPRALNALALLSSGDPQYHPVLRRQAEILSEHDPKQQGRSWHYAYINMFLAEYVLATGDRTLIENGLKRLTQRVVEGQSDVGSWGHGFIIPKTQRLGGYGMMNSPGIPLTFAMVLAREAGVAVPGLDEAIAKSKRLLRFYVGKGAIPYGDHRPWIQTHCDNGKNEMAALLFDFEGDREATEYFSHMALASHGAERDTGHTGNFFNITWALPGVARSGPQATGAWMQEFGWHYDLARRWDGTFPYQGAPEPRPQSYKNWDCTGAYLLGYTQALRHTYFTGKKPSCAPQLDQPTAESIVDDGRGWTNKDRNSYYDALTTPDLLERLSSWSPTVRERTAAALSRKPDDIIDELITRLNATDIHTRYGACQAIKMQRGKAAATIPALMKAYETKDVWLRILVAEALAGIGQTARPMASELLSGFAETDADMDPRNMQQRYLSFAYFNRRGGLFGNSLEGIDRELIYRAVRMGLQNEDGRARSSFGSVYQNLSFEELQPIMIDIVRATLTPAPSGIMFADGIQNSGLELLSKNHVSEGVEMLAHYARHMKKHGSQKRIITVMKMLERYGAHAQRVIDHLEETAVYFETTEEDFPRKLGKEKAKVVREAIKRIQASTQRPELIQLRRGS